VHSKKSTLRWKPCLCGYERTTHHVKYDVGLSMRAATPYLILRVWNVITEHWLKLPLLFLSKFQSELDFRWLLCSTAVSSACHDASNLSTFILTRSIPLCVIIIGTEKYSLAQQYLFKLTKPRCMFQLYSHHQAYLQLLVELYMSNVYAMLDPSREAKNFTDCLVTGLPHSVCI
jgi:hypothetical protein